MKGKQLIKLLESYGWKIKRIKGSHHEMINPEGLKLTVPLHGSKDIPKGFQMVILKQAGITII